MDLTHERLRRLVSYDPDSGRFTRLSTGKTAGDSCKSNPYGRIWLDGKIYLSHRIAWLYMTGDWPAHVIDHIDGNPSNNRFANLRDVPTQGNCQNVKRPKSNNKSGLLGVSQYANKWVASIRLDGRTKWIGEFSSPEAAHEAYMRVKMARHTGFVPP